MTIKEMPFDTAMRVLNMIAYGCIGREGFDGDSLTLLLIRMKPLLPAGEWLHEFSVTSDYPLLGGDDIDQASFDAVRRIQST